MDPPDPAHMAIVRTGEDRDSTSGLIPTWTDCGHVARWVREKQEVKSSSGHAGKRTETRNAR
jgi:hypothetical protein